jgi:adenosine deaminase
MRNILLFFIVFLAGHSIQAQKSSLDSVFEVIRKDSTLLRRFTRLLPKGGDVHHHFDGSLYAENILQSAIQQNLWFNLSTHTVLIESDGKTETKKLQEWIKDPQWSNIEQETLTWWSAKNFPINHYPSDKLFFESFLKFGQAIPGYTNSGLLEIRNRAIEENIGYIETQFESCPKNWFNPELESMRKELSLNYENNQWEELKILFQKMEEYLEKESSSKKVQEYCQNLQKRHDSLQIDSKKFHLRYMAYVLRTLPAELIFQEMKWAFEVAHSSTLIVGVNLVGPEHHETALNDYLLHLFMLQYFHSKFPEVKIALHAGELTKELARPEFLENHIRLAVKNGASRIGHGIDILTELDSIRTMNDMKQKQIALEVNLTSNEFILGIQGNQHPIHRYIQAGVPILIGSDDAGILRTSISDQYFLLIQRYPWITYRDLKMMIYNHVTYSFWEDSKLKKQFTKDLNHRFRKFEQEILAQ